VTSDGTRLDLPRRVTAEAVGTAFLLAAVIGSGIMGERLAGGNMAVALLANTLATGAALVALILTFGEISGAHFNPAVTLAEAAGGGLAWRDVPVYVLAQIAGAFAGLAGGLFGIFNRGVFPDFAYWTKSSEVLIMTLLGGMGTFFGPALGALVLLWLNQQIVSYTQYWPLILGTILVVLLFVFPGGIAGAALGLWRRLSRRPASA